MTTVASAESLPISVLPDLIVNRERVIFGRRTIPLIGDERDTSSCMCGAYWNNTLQVLTCQGIVGKILAGKYVEEGIALFLESVIRPHQQFKRYDMEVSLYEAPCSLIPCHQNCEI